MWRAQIALCSVDAALGVVVVTGEAGVPVVLLRVEVVVGGRELGVLVRSGRHCSLDIANFAIGSGSGCADFSCLLPVVDIDATTHDALLTQKVLQEIVLDWRSI